MGCIVKTFIYQVTLTFLLGVSYDFIHLKLFLFFHTGVPLSWNGPKQDFLKSKSVLVTHF